MSTFSRLKEIVERTNTLPGRIFDYVVMFLIIFSLISFSVETLPDLSTAAREVLDQLEVVIVIIFTCEYFLRIFVADRKRDYIFSFYGIVDLLAIAPFYIMTTVDLRSIRVFRLLRIIRLLKLFRYGKAVERFQLALQMVREELILFSFVTLVLLWLSAVGIYYFENEAQPEHFASIFHSLWWAVATLTTVGYGDVFPVTIGGRIFTFFILLIGLGVVAVPAGLFASALTKVRQDERTSDTKATETWDEDT